MTNRRSSRASSDAWQACRRRSHSQAPTRTWNAAPTWISSGCEPGWVGTVMRRRATLPSADAASSCSAPPPRSATWSVGRRGSRRQGELACASAPGECAQTGVAARGLQLAAGPTAGVGAPSLACQLPDTGRTSTAATRPVCVNEARRFMAGWDAISSPLCPTARSTMVRRDSCDRARRGGQVAQLQWRQ